MTSILAPKDRKLYKGNMAGMTLRVDKVLRDRFKAACAYRGKSVNAAVEEYMRLEVAKWEKEMRSSEPSKPKGSE